MIYTNPLFGLIRFFFLFVSGRVFFNKRHVDWKLITDDGNDFTIFRKAVVKRRLNKNRKSEGLFIVRFTPTMDNKKNIKLSALLMPFIMGFKGFRSKYWCVNEKTGTCLGIYEWDSIEDADRYSKSVAVRNMTKRSLRNSITFRVLRNKEENRSWQLFDPGADKKLNFKKKYGIA